VSTLGQRQFLIKSRTQINIHQFSGKTTPTQYKDKQDATHPGRGLTPRMDWAAGLFPGSFPDVRIRRTRMPVGRTSPSTRLGGQYKRPADVPVGDSDRDRDVAQPRSGWLSSRSPTTASTRLQRRPTVPVPVSSRGPIGSHSCCCLRWRRRRQPTYHGCRSRPAGRCSTLCSLATANWNRSSQQTAAAALTMRSSTSPTKVTRKYVRSLARSNTHLSSLASPLKHVLLT